MKTTLKNTAIILLWVGALGITQSCRKETFSPPVILTMVASEVTQTTAKSGGVIGDDGGADVTARGVCWSTSPDPTTDSDKTTDGSGSGLFTSVITALTPNTTYYIRAYAVNSEGTSYGDQLVFTTSFQTTGIKKADFPGGERYQAVSFAIGTKIYSGLGWSGLNVGMKDFWEWDQTTNIWTKKADYPGNSVVGAVGMSIGSKGYIGTGYTNTGSYTNEFWEYDPATNTWTEKASLPSITGRGDATGFSIGTKGYIGTGVHVDEFENFTVYQDFWEWDQATNLWTRKADVGGSGRYGAVGFSIGTKGYIGTGYGVQDGYSQEFWEWDQATNIWTKRADLERSGRVYAVGFSIGTKGFIGTGFTGEPFNDSYSSDFWEWDQATNKWTRKADLAANGRYSAIAVSIGDKAYIGFGYSLELEYSLKDFWEYIPE